MLLHFFCCFIKHYKEYLSLSLYRTHYKEYLVCKINKHKLDPSELYAITQLKRFLEREEKEVPKKNLEDDQPETDEEYKQRLIEVK